MCHEAVRMMFGKRECTHPNQCALLKTSWLRGSYLAKCGILLSGSGAYISGHAFTPFQIDVPKAARVLRAMKVD